MLLQTGISPKGRRYGGFFGSHPRLQHSVHSDIVATLVLYEASIVRTYSSTQNTWENTSKPNIPSPGKRHPKIKKSGTGWSIFDRWEKYKVRKTRGLSFLPRSRSGIIRIRGRNRTQQPSTAAINWRDSLICTTQKLIVRQHLRKKD